MVCAVVGAVVGAVACVLLGAVVRFRAITMPSTLRRLLLGASPRWWIGVDGGGSATRARWTSADGGVLGQGQAGPSALSLGIEPAWANIRLAIQRAADDAGLPAWSAADCAVGLGLAGAGMATRVEPFLQAAPAFGLLHLDTDVAAALQAAHGGGPGVVVIAGTGSIAQSISTDGCRRTCGGWGHGLGDEGSGAWLGLQAVRLAQRMLDGRCAQGSLARAVCSATAGQREAMQRWCVAATAPQFARLAPLVFAHAAHDPSAAALLREAASALAELATAADPSQALPLTFLGSIGLRLIDHLPDRLRQRQLPARGDALDGALALARLAWPD